MTKEERRKQNRQTLISLSLGARMMVTEGAYDSINEGLLDLYDRELNGKPLKSFYSWKIDGFRVKKGEHSKYFIWGKPKRYVIDNDNPDSEEAKEMKYYPICYLFTQDQVEKIES